MSETRELLKEVRELIQLVKTEKETKKQTDAKKSTEVRKAD